jgi:uncharacterized protein with GYD domain
MEIPVPLETAVRDGRAVLFLGAGASMEALDGHGKHPPNAQQLSELLAARFLGGRYKHLPLSQVAEYAINETDLRTAQVKWVANYAILGPYDYLDIFEAPDETTAAKVVMIIRSYGHGQTETWTAMPWERFEIVLPR